MQIQGVRIRTTQRVGHHQRRAIFSIRLIVLIRPRDYRIPVQYECRSSVPGPSSRDDRRSAIRFGAIRKYDLKVIAAKARGIDCEARLRPFDHNRGGIGHGVFASKFIFDDKFGIKNTRILIYMTRVAVKILLISLIIRFIVNNFSR